MIEDLINEEIYRDIEESLREEVDRRINKVIARYRHESLRLKKTSPDESYYQTRIKKLHRDAEIRINGIFAWAREQSC